MEDRAIRLNNCKTCLNNNEEWDSDSCDSCCKNHSNYDRAISLNDAIKAVRHAEVNFSVQSEIDFTKHKREVHEIIDNILDAQEKALRELPSVTPQPKKGNWIMTLCTATTNNGIALEGVACSGCNKITFMTNKTPLRCPWCDMDMRGDDNESGN